MKNQTIKRYETSDYKKWNDFIALAKNATFLFHRDFMEYHSDRFQDFSLIVSEDDKWIAVLPANRVGETVYSHQGLTYGGFVYDKKTKLSTLLSVFKTTLNFLEKNQITKLQLKIIPNLYCQYFSEELAYALFICKAKLIERNCLSVIDLGKPYSVSKTRKESIRRGIKNKLVIKEENQFELFWNSILIPNLQKKHDASPVHSAAEMIELQKKFPNNIRHFNVYFNDAIVAGTTVFITDKVAHPQYISGNEKKNELGSLDYLYSYLIADVFKDKNYFDFGPSHEENGMKINSGILFWKESFGAKTTIQSYYEVNTANYNLLDNILI